MNRNPIAIILTDTHLSLKTSKINQQIYNQAIDLAKSLNVKAIYHGGDVFTSRKQQPLDNLTSFSDILNKFKSNDIDLYVIPGNHDKVNYTSERSYLDVYDWHTNCTIFPRYGLHENNGVNVWFVPYFQEGEIYLQYLNSVKQSMNVSHINVLITHIAINGVRNNDGTLVDQGIHPDCFEQFDFVYVGHYHDKSTINSTIQYVGSAYQSNYGENTDKGFTVLYDDGSCSFVNSTFPKYIKYDIDLLQERERLNDLVIGHQSDRTDNHVKFNLIGPKEVVKSFDTNQYKKLGFDVSVESIEYSKGLQDAYQDNFTTFSKETIEKEFSVFCEVNEISQSDKQFALQRYIKPILQQ